MNYLGHPYVTYKVTGRIAPYLMAGSLLPDLIPFIPSKLYTYEKSWQEIHEAGERLYVYLRKKHPEKLDLAIGMLAHSKEFGADGYNHEIGSWLLANNPQLKEELVHNIMKCSKVSYYVASTYRLHNYLWIGIDLYLLKHKKEFIKKLSHNLKQIESSAIGGLFSKGIEKDIKEIARMAKHLFNVIEPNSLTSKSGLVKIWKNFMAGLPEKDEISQSKSLILFDKIYKLFEPKWPTILSTVISQIQIKMRRFLS